VAKTPGAAPASAQKAAKLDKPVVKAAKPPLPAKAVKAEKAEKTQKAQKEQKDPKEHKPQKVAKAGKATLPATAAAVAPAAPTVAAKPAKQKLVRDSFTIPRQEYQVLDALKQRLVDLRRPTKKSELLRAGIQLLASLADAKLLDAVRAVPSIKTGRPGRS